MDFSGMACYDNLCPAWQLDIIQRVLWVPNNLTRHPNALYMTPSSHKSGLAGHPVRLCCTGLSEADYQGTVVGSVGPFRVQGPGAAAW